MTRQYLTQSGKIYMKRQRWRWEGLYSFWSNVSRRKSKTGRLLTSSDGGARKWLRRVERHHGVGREFISFIVQALLETASPGNLRRSDDDIRSWEKIVPPFPRVSYEEAVALLREAMRRVRWKHKFEWGGDFDRRTNVLCRDAISRR